MSGSQDEIPPPPPPLPSSSQTPTQQTPQTVSTIKLPILKKGEYDIWAMKMEHYLAHTDYPIWEGYLKMNCPSINHHRYTRTNQINLALGKGITDMMAFSYEKEVITKCIKGNYMPSGPDIEIDYSQFTYGPKQTQSSESETQISEFDTCESNISTETPELVSEPIVNESNVACQPKVWSDAPIIEEYESDSEDEALQNKEIVDSGCSKNMTGNKAYLAKYQDFNGGPVDFGGSKGYITGKGKIKTRKLDFEDVCFVKELQHFNLFSVCDKKNKVLFTDSECLVLSPEFKRLASFNSKATIDESTKWHRRVLVTKPHNKTPYELINCKIPIKFYIRPFGCHVTILNTIDHLGKFDGKSDEGFLVGYSLQSKAFRVYNLETKRVEENLHITFLENKPNVAGKGPTWLFDLDYLTDSMNYQPVRSENQANKHAGLQEANQNAGTEDIIDAGDSEKEDDSAQDYFVLPIWSSYSSTIKRSRAEDAGVAPHKHPDLKTDEKPDLLLQAGAAKPSSTNIVNTASTPVSTASTDNDLPNPDQDDSEIPALEDIYKTPTDVKQKADGIFISQDKYVAEILKKFDFVNVKTASTPIETQKPLVKEEEASQKLCLQGCALFSDFQVTPKTSHLSAVKRIFRYLKGKPKLGLWYPRVSSFDLEAYSDSDYTGANLDRKSTTGGPVPHLDAKKKFVMYPRFISIFLNKQLVNVPVPLDHFPVNALTSKVFSFMVKKGKHFSGKVTPLFASMLVQSTEDEGATSERPSEPQPTPSPPHPSEANVEPQSDPSPRPSPTPHIPDSIPEVSGGNQGGQSSSDRSLSGTEGGMTLQSVYDLCISLCTQVTDQAKEIKNLKAQIKKLKKQAKPVITHHRAWMKSVSLKQRLAGKKSLKSNWMQKESVSKQGRKSAKAEPSVHKDPLFDELDDDEIDNMDTEDAQDVGRSRDVVNEEKENADAEVSTEDVLSTAQQKVSTDNEKVSTDRPKVSTDGSKIDPKDKGKKKIEEEDESETESEGIPEAEKKFKQLASDEEMARKLQEDWETEEERKRLAEEEATKTALSDEYDFIQARIEADRLLALRLQDEERDQFTVEERAKFLHDTIAAQRRFLAEQRAIAIRNKPPTRTQLRNQMMTYLKHVGNKKHSDLKSKTFEEIQALYEKVKRFDESFTVVGSTEDERRIKEMNEGVKDTNQKRLKEEDTTQVPAKVEVTEQGTKKRKGGHIKMIARKKPRRQLDKVSSPDGDYLVIYRANGNFRAFNYLMEVLHIFDRQDLFHLYELMMEQYSEITLEGFELILWGDLKIMMESSTEENDQSDFWIDNKIGRLTLRDCNESCEICILELEDGIVIHMLVERRYPLSKELLQRMLDL
ncbi:ribonuclease H-like domain-containing protein [Tanacetum coccineum]